MIEITAEQAIGALRKVVEGNEGKIAECVYVDPDGEPACIVANALVKCGASMELLSDLDKYQSNAFYGIAGASNVPHILRKHGVSLDKAAYDIFSIAQRVQDGNASSAYAHRDWGYALAAAEDIYA